MELRIAQTDGNIRRKEPSGYFAVRYDHPKLSRGEVTRRREKPKATHALTAVHEQAKRQEAAAGKRSGLRIGFGNKSGPLYSFGKMSVRIKLIWAIDCNTDNAIAEEQII